MVKKAPKGVIVIAVLQLAFGLLGLVDGAVQMTGLANQLTGLTSPETPGQPAVSPRELEDYWGEHVPGYRPIMGVGGGAASVLLSLMMIVGGIGLLRVRRWAHRLTLFYAVLDLLWKAAQLGWTFALVLPTVGGFVAEMAAHKGRDAEVMAQVIGYGTAGSMVFLTVVTAIYPLIVLWVMLLRSVRAAFRGEGLTQPEPEDYYDTPPAAADFNVADDRFQTGDR